MTENEVVVKIRKLLELASADRNPSAHEAETAMAKVQELLAKYELDLATVQQADNQPKEEFETAPYGPPQRRRSMQSKYIEWLLNRYFHVRIVYSRGYVLHKEGTKRYIRKLFDSEPGSGWTIVFLGRKTQVAIAQHVYAYLAGEFERLWKQYRAQTSVSAGAKNGFFAGLYHGLAERLEKEQHTRAQAASPTVRDSMALMVRSEAHALTTYFYSIWGESGRRRSVSSPSDMSAYGDGVAAGRNLNIRPAANAAIGRRSLPSAKVTTE